MFYCHLYGKDIQLIPIAIVDLEDNTVRHTKNTGSLTTNHSSIIPILVWKKNSTHL